MITITPAINMALDFTKTYHLQYRNKDEIINLSCFIKHNTSKIDLVIHEEKTML